MGSPSNFLMDSNDIDGLDLIHMFRQEIWYDRPMYLGSSIWDLSKLHTMKFHYGVIAANFKYKYDRIYSDTDVLVYNIKHPDVFEWMKRKYSPLKNFR